jgi:hypothetical protein
MRIQVTMWCFGVERRIANAHRALDIGGGSPASWLPHVLLPYRPSSSCDGTPGGACSTSKRNRQLSPMCCGMAVTTPLSPGCNASDRRLNGVRQLRVRTPASLTQGHGTRTQAKHPQGVTPAFQVRAKQS